MPIYEYGCRSCGEQFELLMLTGTVAACPSCQGQDLERQVSGFAVNSAEISQARVKKAREANRASSNIKDKMRAEAEHIRDHETDHRERVQNE